MREENNVRMNDVACPMWGVRCPMTVTNGTQWAQRKKRARSFAVDRGLWTFDLPCPAKWLLTNL